MVEEKLKELILKSDYKAIEFYLKHKYPRYRTVNLTHPSAQPEGFEDMIGREERETEVATQQL